jgi:DNA polymerase-3 subunit delta
LLLYAGTDAAISESHIEAVVGDTAQREQAALVDAVFAGRLPVLDLTQAKLVSEGLDPGVMLGAVLRHALALLKARQGLDSGRGARDAVAAMRLPFPRLAAAEAAVNAWSTEKLTEAVGVLGTAMLAVRRDGEVARPTAARALWTLARLGQNGRNR